MEHLSGLDAAFLYLETPETPLHVGNLMLFELPAGYTGNFHADVKKIFAERMHLVPLFERKLMPMPFDLSDPVWVHDDDVELDYHVRHVTLDKPGTMAQLEAMVARLHAPQLDRSRPLWEVYIIDGLADGRVAYYFRGHHAGIDGKSGVEMNKVLYDPTPEPRAVTPRRRRGHAETMPGMSELLQAAFTNSMRQYAKAAEMLPGVAKAVNAAGQLALKQLSGGGERGKNLLAAPRTVFNGHATNQRSFATMSVSLAEVKALGKRVGGTVNSIVMAMCSTALRRFLSERNALPDKPLVAMVPVSLRAAGDSSMNNQVSTVRVDLATDIKDPAERLKVIHASSEDAKAVVRELAPALRVEMPALFGAPWLISGVASLMARAELADRTPVAANVMISNVPGVNHPLYLAGAKLVHYFPASNIGQGIGLNITVQSYDGKLDMAVMACRRMISQPEAHELIGYLEDALREIEALAPAG
jgi:diacylglycerol O-acyltransferase